MNCYEGPTALKEAKEYFRSNTIGDSICDGVIIENQSSYNLEYVTSGYNAGWPAGDVRSSFKVNPKDPDSYIIPPRGVSVQVWQQHQMGQVGKWIGNVLSLGISSTVANSHVEGFVSVRVATPGKAYVVPLGFLLGRNRCNKMGIQIRGQDGALDVCGNVAGHGVDPTGNVTDIAGFVSQVPFAALSNDLEQQMMEQTSTFKVVGKFNNEYVCTHHFIFKDVPTPQ